MRAIISLVMAGLSAVLLILCFSMLALSFQNISGKEHLWARWLPYMFRVCLGSHVLILNDAVIGGDQTAAI